MGEYLQKKIKLDKQTAMQEQCLIRKNIYLRIVFEDF